ncbi:MAG: GNAT family N-acetyltransferase [Trueperaceae bacterium]
MSWSIQPFDPQSASEETVRPVHEFLVAIEAELEPEDPPRSLEYTVSNFRSYGLISSQTIVTFYAWSGKMAVDRVFVEVGNEEENRHMLWADVAVLATHRRRGIGRALFEKAVEVAEAEGRRLIIGSTDSAVPAGEAFVRRTGASVGLIEATSELRLSGLDHDILAAWQRAAPTHEFRLLTWLGPYPEEYMERMAALHEVMNTAPKGDLDYEDERVTPEDLREWEAYAAARGVEPWTVVAQHKSSGELVGYTGVDWRPDKPGLLDQSGTVVNPKYRRRGLGRWLKATMLDLVLRERQQVTRVRTSNAYSNESMLRINEALGFRQLRTETEWQVATERAREYLTSSKGSL